MVAPTTYRRPGGPPREAGSGPSPAPRRFVRRKMCRFCNDKIDRIDYKDIIRIKRYVTERGKIVPRRISGTCAKHQRQLKIAIKRARNVALIPYTGE